MSPKEVLQSLKIYTKTKEYNPGSDDITSEKFESLVRSDPYEYSKLGASLLDIVLKYCHHFLNALLDPIKLSSKISWAEVLDLCFQLLNKSNEPLSGKREFYFGANPIAHFLCTALGGKTVLVPITLRDKVWSIVECLVNLTKNKDTLSYLIGEKDIRTDYHFSMINSALFCSVECLLFYNSWFNSSIHDPNVRSILPEVKQILDDLVGHSNPTIQVRCAISSNLSYLISLDIEWTRGYLKKIIPSLAENKVSYYAAWECYLIRNAVRSNTFAPLYPYYLRRIRNLKNDPNDYGKSQATEALVVHVLHAYLLDANDSDILFEEFMNNSTNEMLSTCLRKLAFLLLKYKEDKKAAINLNRVRRIWELEKFRDCEDFLDLFVNSPFDKKTSISLLHKFLTGL